MLLIGGCGGTSGPSKSHYIAEADRVCQSVQTQAAPLIRRLTSAAGSLTAAQARQLAGVVQQLHSVGAQYISQLQALEQPSGDHKAIEKFLQPSKQTIAAIGQAGNALSNGQPTQALAVLQQAQPLAQQANTAAQAYGFKQCGSVIPVSG